MIVIKRPKRQPRGIIAVSLPQVGISSNIGAETKQQFGQEAVAELSRARTVSACLRLLGDTRHS